MANYETLKGTIRSVIRENGNNEITGNLLQQSLISMITSLGALYQYAGVATPSTNPGTPDQNVFYIASEPGTYSNFGGIVLNDDEVAVLKYNGTWTKDATGVANAAKTESEIKDLFDTVDSVSLKFIKREPDSVITGQYFNGSGAFVASDNFAIWKYGNIVPGTKYAFSGYRSATSHVYFLAWYAADGTTVVKVEPYKGGSSWVRYTEKPVIAPEGAAYAFLNVRTSQASYHGFFDTERVSIVSDNYRFAGVAVPEINPGTPDENVFYIASQPGVYENFGGIVVYNGDVPALCYNGTEWIKMDTRIASKDELDKLRSLTEVRSEYELAEYAYDVGQKFEWDGSIRPSTTGTAALLKFQVEGGKQYAFSGTMAISFTLYFLAWYDENGNYIYKEPYRGRSGVPTSYNKQLVVAPDNAAYAYMNVNIINRDRFKLYNVEPMSAQEIYDNTVLKTNVIDNLGSNAVDAPLSANQGRVLSDEINSLDYELRDKTFNPLEPDSILENTRCYNRNIESSNLIDLYIYEIDPTLKYSFSGRYPATVSLYFVAYYTANDTFISYDIYRGGRKAVVYENVPLNVPGNAKYIKMNVYRSIRSAFSLSKVDLLGFLVNDVVGGLKVVVREDKSFYVRHHIDAVNDGILLFDYYTAYAYKKNMNIGPNSYYVGAKDLTDKELLADGYRQGCSDMQSPMFTANFGPLFSNHGYSTPRVRITGHSLTPSDIGTEWVDQNGYRYTIGNINGDLINLMPVIITTGVPGQETRQWKWYTSPYPTQITRNVSGGETLQVTASARWDIQVAEVKNVRIVINGKSVEPGTYYCDRAVLAYEQIGYNPVEITTWFPEPVYNGVMVKFDRHYTIDGGDGFLGVTANTVVNSLYPYPLHHYIDVIPMFPRPMGEYSPHVFIPKMKKVTSSIDFREEFVPVPGVTTIINYARNSTDLVDVNDMPDRAYCYMMDGNGGILFGCAGGHSLVRGMSVKSIRNQYIEMGGNVGAWNPGAGNKHYNNILLTTGETDNILPDTFLNEFEGFVCWYKPSDGVQSFYHRTKDGYVAYIHTNQADAKGVATFPDFMNNYAVDTIVEQTSGITLRTNTVVDGRIFFSADTSEVEYQYIVFLLKP